MKTNCSSYFLGSNTPHGFVSHFETAYDISDGWRVFIIKGGPGTGKSCLMNKVAQISIDEGVTVEKIFCSSDPDSLDAVILPKKKKMILDGTSPHVVEPKLPGACENIINLGDFWDSENLIKRSAEINMLSKTCTRLHSQASRYLFAADSFMRDTRVIAERATNKEKAIAYAEKFADREFGKKSSGKGKEYIRLLSAVTPLGVTFFEDTIKKNCKRIVVLKDEWGIAAPVVLSVLRERALSAGFEFFSCLSHISPYERIEHIIIPELDLCISTENKYTEITSGIEKKIHAVRFTDMEKINPLKDKISFNKKKTEEMLEEASNTIKDAKSTHDVLEKIYIDSMDFESLNEYIASFIDHNFKN